MERSPEGTVHGGFSEVGITLDSGGETCISEVAEALPLSLPNFSPCASQKCQLASDGVLNLAANFITLERQAAP